MGHRLVRHPNLHGLEITRRSHVTLYYLFSLFSSDSYLLFKRGPHGNWSYQIGLPSINKDFLFTYLFRLLTYLVVNYDSRTYKSPLERERKRERDKERKKDREKRCLIA